MKQVVLKNGVTLLCVESGKSGFEVAITFKFGHQNEPKLGLAALYENIVAAQAGGRVSTVYGGNITSFYTGNSGIPLSRTLRMLWNCCNPAIDDETVQASIDDIVQHTVDLAAVPMRQTKLAYKHTAFSQDQVVWNTEEYIAKVSALTKDDVKAYIDKCFVGSNIVVSFNGPETSFDRFQKLTDELLGNLPEGNPVQVKTLLYTGGYQEIPGNGTVSIAMFGWDISNLSNYAETNVLMSMLSGRLERAIAPLSATSEVRIAGYFGFRTLRICVSCYNRRNVSKVIDAVCANVARLKHENASDRRLETSKQRAMTERLSVSNETLPQSVNAAWLHLKRGIELDNDRCIRNIYRTTADDVRDMANDIFSQKMTCVIYGAKSSEKEIAAMMQ